MQGCSLCTDGVEPIRILLKQRESNNLESQGRPKPKSRKDKNKNPTSAFLQTGTNKHSDLRKRRLSHPHCTEVMPVLALGFLPPYPHTLMSPVLCLGLFKHILGINNCFLCGRLVPPNPSFPRKLFAMEPQKKGGSVWSSFQMNLVIKFCNDLVTIKFYL